MRSATCALSISGVISIAEAGTLAAAIDRFFPDVSATRTSDSLLDGEREFFSTVQVPHDIMNTLTMAPKLAEVLSSLDLSYALFVPMNLAKPSPLLIVDREIDAMGRLVLRDGEICFETITPGSMDDVLATKWGENVDLQPPLIVVKSHHQAMELAKAPGPQPKTVKAYLARQAREDLHHD